MSCFAQSGAATPTIGSIGSAIEGAGDRTRLGDARSSHRRSVDDWLSIFICQKCIKCDDL
jgi:hypothetical protein